MENDELRKQITVFVGCVIKDDKVFMVQRTEEECPAAHLKWELPGGKTDFGETPQESLKREFREETGLVIEVKELLHYVEVSYWDYPWGKQQTLIFCFKCEHVETLATPKDHHVYKLEWISLENLKKLKLLPGVEKFITLASNL